MRLADIFVCFLLVLVFVIFPIFLCFVFLPEAHAGESYQHLDDLLKDVKPGDCIGFDRDSNFKIVGNCEFYYAGEPEENYAKGVNDALETTMLLDLELKLKGERKTWGEMADIVRERLGVNEN